MCSKKFQKSRFFQYWTFNVPNFILEVNDITMLVSFSRAICYSLLIFLENCVFEAKKSCFFDRKLMFYKEISIFNPFLPNSKLWPPVVGATAVVVTLELSHISGSERIIGSPPSSNGVVIGPLLSLGWKNLFIVWGRLMA